MAGIGSGLVAVGCGKMTVIVTREERPRAESHAGKCTSSLVSYYRHCKTAGERWMPRYKIWLPLYFLWELSQLLNLSELLSIKLRRVLLPRVVVRTK